MVKESLAKIKKHLTSTKLTINGQHYHMDKHVYKHALNRRNLDDKKKNKLRKKDEFEYAVLCYKADKALQRNPFPDVKRWRNYNDIKAYLGPLKNKMIDPTWPSRRDEMENLFMQWTDRRRFQLVLERDMMNKFCEWISQDKTKNTTKKQGKSI